MISKNNFLKFCFWSGAVFDVLVVVPMLSPRVGGFMFGILDFSPGAEYKFAMRIGASLMVGWAILLIWAARRPQERIAIMILTLFPVLSGIMSAEIFVVISGFIKANKMIPIWVIQSVLFILFIYAGVVGRKKSENYGKI